MTSIAQQVWSVIEKDVIIKRAIERGVVSSKNLAVYLSKKGVHASSDAIISAIRRYNPSKTDAAFEKARKVIGKSEDIRITTNIIEIAVEKTEQTQQLLQKAISLVDYNKGDVLLMIQGEKSIKVIINDKNKEKIMNLFSKKSIIHIEKDLAEINIQLSDEAVKTPGIVATLTTELMVNNIPMFEIMSCVPELLLFVKKKDVVKAYELLFKLCGQ
ncbi:hypothetical protein COV18_01325 [Candidatus Woesearchaeota archaeon CG10_big_fil_rev_8_21_14_0_10_37_12]|nr:MAG: hypothetical protein COV18_01325 [Candidatus Woesearchaeota archaeon CG10_big_fil_rev_8_21_14_0_10_37_12]